MDPYFITRKPPCTNHTVDKRRAKLQHIGDEYQRLYSHCHLFDTILSSLDLEELASRTVPVTDWIIGRSGRSVVGQFRIRNHKEDTYILQCFQHTSGFTNDAIAIVRNWLYMIHQFHWQYDLWFRCGIKPSSLLVQMLKLSSGIIV